MISHFTQLSILIFGGFLSFETTVRRDKGTMMLSVVVPAAAGKTASTLVGNINEPPRKNVESLSEKDT